MSDDDIAGLPSQCAGYERGSAPGPEAARAWRRWDMPQRRESSQCTTSVGAACPVGVRESVIVSLAQR